MDYSALTEAQQQQYQQYQQQDQNHHQQQQQTYDPAQTQGYDAYYAYHHQPPPPQQQQQYDASAYHQHQQYYPQDYYSSASYHHPQPAAQPDPAPAPQPPSHAAAPHDTSQIHTPLNYPSASAAAAAPGHGYPPPAAQEQQGPAYQVPPGLNPAAAAAVAALSQLTQFAGTMDAAERAMAGVQDREWHGKGGGMMGPMGGGHHPPQAMHQHHPHSQHTHRQMQHGAAPIHPAVGGRSPYRGGVRRGGGPFRGGGGGRGNFGHRPLRQDGAPPPFRGRGKGRMGSRGGGRRSHQSAPETQSPHTAPAPAMESSTAPEPTKAPAATLVPAPVLPRLPLLPVAWCDVCRVDCNSLEILEQHKNGKRHKKTVQRVEEIQAKQRLIAEIQAKAGVKPELALPKVEENKKAAQVGEPSKGSAASESIPAAVAAAQIGEANKVPTASENVPTPVWTIESRVETEVQSQTVEGQSEPVKSDTAMEVPAAEMPPSDELVAEAPPAEELHAKRPRMDSYERPDWRHGPKGKMARFGRGGKRLRSFEPVRGRPVERPKEQPRCCTLCNVMCDTQAVFECHLSGKKHVSRVKRFQGQGSIYGPISVYIPPNQPTASQGPEPLFFGLKSHEILQQEAYGPNGLQAGSFGAQQGDQNEQATEAEGVALDFLAEQCSDRPKGELLPENEGQVAVASDPQCQNAVPQIGAKDATMSDEATFSITADVVPPPEFGASFGDNVVLPGLDVKVEEPGANNEELGGGGATAVQ